MSDAAARVEAEIIRLHREFERWFEGDADDFSVIEQSLTQDFTMIPPSGTILERERILGGIHSQQGEHQTALRITNVRAVYADEGLVIAVYEEWQDQVDHTTGRQSTAILMTDSSRPLGLIWHHVHETWILPPPAH